MKTNNRYDESFGLKPQEGKANLSEDHLVHFPQDLSHV